MNITEEINKAKKVLEDAGYYVGNLWSTEDVTSNYECTEEEAQDVLDKALQLDSVMIDIWMAIDYVAEEHELKSKQ